MTCGARTDRQTHRQTQLTNQLAEFRLVTNKRPVLNNLLGASNDFPQIEDIVVNSHTEYVIGDRIPCP